MLLLCVLASDKANEPETASTAGSTLLVNHICTFTVNYMEKKARAVVMCDLAQVRVATYSNCTNYLKL